MSKNDRPVTPPTSPRELVRRINGIRVGKLGGLALWRDPRTGLVRVSPRIGDGRFAGLYGVRHV